MLDKAVAIIATDSGLSSDLAVYATMRHIPAVVGLNGIPQTLIEGQPVTVDPVRGLVYKGHVKV
jgi:pyruvate kinase